MKQNIAQVTIDESCIPPHLRREMFEKACRNSLWQTLLLSQELGWQQLSNRITTLLVEVDERRQASEEDAIAAADDEADEIACVSETFGPEIGERFAAGLAKRPVGA